MNTKKITYLLTALTMAFAMACGTGSDSKSQMAHDEAGDHDMPAEEHPHDMSEGHASTNMDHEEMMAGFTWMPDNESMSMLENKTDNIRVATSGEEDVLMFEPAGQSASCMFKGKQGNVGVTATVKLEKPGARVRLLHHSTDQDNYEFVSIADNMMQLGRVEDGEEKILDTKEVTLPAGWFTLTVTAAGTHYKGYLNGEMITHGHADVMAPGLLGIVVSGNGAVSVKKVEATPLEAEH